MVKAFLQIQEISQSFAGKKPDDVQAFIYISKILETLKEFRVINESSFVHHQIKLDFLILSQTNKDLSTMDCYEVVASKYNLSPRTIQGIVYEKGKEKKKTS